MPKWVKQLLDGKDPPVLEESTSTLRRSRRIEEQQQKVEVNLVNYALMMKVFSIHEPSSFEEAKVDPKWVNAMKFEFDAIL